MKNISDFRKSIRDIFIILLWVFGSIILFYIISIFSHYIVGDLIKKLRIQDIIIFLFNQIDISRQLAMPFVFGIIGSSATSLIMLLKGHTDVKLKVFKGKLRRLNWIITVLISSFIGGIAGIGAVNILNSDGSPTEVLVIALVAGLSGVSYLKGIALVNGTEENGIFTKIQEETVDNGTNLIALGAIQGNEYADSWEEFIDTWVNYKVSTFINDNPEHTDEDFSDFISDIENQIYEIWKGDNENE